MPYLALAVGGVVAALLAVYLDGGHLALPWQGQHMNAAFKLEKTTTSYSFAPYVGGLDSPTFVTAAPGDPDTLYVVERRGTIRIVQNGKIVGTFLDVRNLVVGDGERGLLSMAFSPEYESDHLFYISYTDVHGNSRVARYHASNGRAESSSAHVILAVHQPFPNHNGGQLQFDRRGYLYFGFGDGGSGGDPLQNAQNLHARLGKLLRSQTKTPSSSWRIVGLGLRNPWRFSFDPSTDNLWLGDVGQSRFEEVDFRRAGLLDKLANFGWSRYEGYSVFARRHRYSKSGGKVSGGTVPIGPVITAGSRHLAREDRLSAASATHLRRLLAEGGVGERLQRLVQCRELAGQAEEVLVVVETLVRLRELVADAVELLEDQVEAPVGEVVLHVLIVIRRAPYASVRRRPRRRAQPALRPASRRPPPAARRPRARARSRRAPAARR